MDCHLFKDEKTVTITGSNGALGFELAKKFSVNGYDLILHSRKDNKKKFLALKTNISYVTGDIGKDNTLNKIFIKIKKIKSNVLINNAGIYLNKSFKNTNLKQIDEIMNVNFITNIKLIKKISKLNYKDFLIININSIAGISGSANETIYSASKHALKGFYDSLEKESGHSFSIMNIFPGAFKSKISKKRPDYSKLMSPNEIADIIFKNVKNYSSLKINNIFLKRKIY